MTSCDKAAWHAKKTKGPAIGGMYGHRDWNGNDGADAVLHTRLATRRAGMRISWRHQNAQTRHLECGTRKIVGDGAAGGVSALHAARL